MANTATVTQSGSTYKLNVNSNEILSSTDSTRVNTIKDRLNRIFSDTNRDLDFITPSYANGCYVVCCPLVRKNQNQKTYFYDTSANAANNYYAEKLYEESNWNDTTSSSTQTAILTVTETSKQWYWALFYANKIRAAITLNFNDAKGNSSCQPLVMPANQGTSVSLISNPTRFSAYGNVCQGSSSGTTSSCSCANYPNTVQNILSVGTASNKEVFHPQDLTAAIQTGPEPKATSGWYALYMHKFVKVTNLSDTTKSIVVKITDKGTLSSGIEVSARAYRELGYPAPTLNSVKIELLSN